MLFPLYVDLSDKKILVAGAGNIAARRVNTLLHFADQIRVVAPEIGDRMQELADAGNILIERRCFQENDLNQADLVCAATNDVELNTRIYALCKERQIPVNVCSDQTLCDFQFPSVIETEGLVIGINGSGKDHKKVKQMRMALEEMITEATGQTCSSLYREDNK